MESRLTQQKPDPAIKKNVLKARANVKKGNRAQGFVAGASLVATMLAAIVFSHQDAEQATLAQAQVSTSTPAAVVQQAATSTPTVSIVTNTNSTTATSSASTSQSSTSSSTPQAITSTRSSQ